ncbi:hypothetical protein AAIB33_12305 [Microbacterium sp. AZCO]|uniref:hypothetical protein n=1 Tax=Microbacterium sp. AZCO TaxID=3142976 RepID=UPI0031F3F284
MSTTGNEYERPGVNHPDRKDAGGAADTPREGEPERDVPEQHEVENPEQAAGVPGAGAAEPGYSGSFPPPSDEPTHEAVGIGVIDDGTTAPATPGGRSQSGQDGPTYGDQAAGGHQGQDGGRDTMTAGQAQREGGLGTEQEQRLPAMSQNNANDIEKISGIVVQTRDDLAATAPEKVPAVLRQRLAQAGISLPERDIDELAKQITTGDA